MGGVAKTNAFKAIAVALYTKSEKAPRKNGLRAGVEKILERHGLSEEE
jgi:hypothetical protein